MNRIFAGIKPLDYVLTAVLVVLALFIAWENTRIGASDDLAHPADSHSALMLPVFALSALPILWRRRAILAAIAVSTIVVAASLPMFGWVTRCGYALPLAFAFAYAVARFAGGVREQVIGLVGVIVLQVVTLAMDSSTGGLEALALSLPITAVVYGVGLFVAKRAAAGPSASTLATEHVPA